MARMATDYLSYWKPSTVDLQIAKGGLQAHAASNQYNRVRIGNTVWLVTVRSGLLRLVNRIKVGHRTGQAEAARLLGVSANQLWTANYHIVAADGTARENDERDIQHLARQLRFESNLGNDRLMIGKDGKVNARQLQTMRVLSSESAKLLAGVKCIGAVLEERP